MGGSAHQTSCKIRRRDPVACSSFYEIFSFFFFLFPPSFSFSSFFFPPPRCQRAPPGRAHCYAPVERATEQRIGENEHGRGRIYRPVSPADLYEASLMYRSAFSPSRVTRISSGYLFPPSSSFFFPPSLPLLFLLLYFLGFTVNFLSLSAWDVVPLGGNVLHSPPSAKCTHRAHT